MNENQSLVSNTTKKNDYLLMNEFTTSSNDYTNTDSLATDTNK